MTTELAPAVAPETTTPIKPSEALRLGRLIRPLPLRGLILSGDDRACALGAMAVGVGIEAHFMLQLMSRWPDLRKKTHCPTVARELRPDACLWRSVDGVTTLEMVYHLNDVHCWSDDQIVEWLESNDL